jgi:hypothetical protein
MNVHQMEIIGNIEQRLKMLEQTSHSPSPSRWPWQNMMKKKKEEETQQQQQNTPAVELDL